MSFPHCMLSLSLEVLLNDFVGWLLVDSLDVVNGRSRATAVILPASRFAEDAGRLRDLGASTECIEMLKPVLTSEDIVHFDVKEHVEDVRVMRLRVEAGSIATKP